MVSMKLVTGTFCEDKSIDLKIFIIDEILLQYMLYIFFFF